MKIRSIDHNETNLVAGLFDRYRMFYGQPSDPVLSRQYIQSRLDNHESIIFVAFLSEAGKTIAAGFTQLYPRYSSVRAIKNWTLNDLYVDPAYRNQHIGSALITAAREFALQQGAAVLDLETAMDNFSAQGLYEKMGFIRQSPDNNFFIYHLFLDIQNTKT